ncbi:MAG TPA: hypothetical protein VJP77_05850 [Planctomycetota bacterium]|nr:hypothetical protein [Planctomycetota bacterium]
MSRPKTQKCERCAAMCEYTTSIGTGGQMSAKVCQKCWDEVMRRILGSRRGKK